MDISQHDIYDVIKIDGLYDRSDVVPGCEVQFGRSESTYGIVIARNKNRVTVLWSCLPFDEHRLTQELAKQIADEIDREILNDLSFRLKL